MIFASKIMFLTLKTRENLFFMGELMNIGQSDPVFELWLKSKTKIAQIKL